MSLTNGIIDADSLHAGDGQLILDVQIPWYRSLPLSCVELLEIAVNGEPVDVGHATFRVNEHEYRLDDLGDRYDEFWFVQDRAQVTAPYSGAIRAGDKAEVTVRLDTRIPYILTGPDTAFTNSLTVTKALIAR